MLIGKREVLIKKRWKKNTVEGNKSEKRESLNIDRNQENGRD
jgi:hypothetical protein